MAETLQELFRKMGKALVLGFQEGFAKKVNLQFLVADPKKMRKRRRYLRMMARMRGEL